MNNTKQIWENRYTSGDNSGAGSYGVLCEYKASFINNIIHQYHCNTILELGCGDGNQLQYFDINQYIGVDISEYIIKYCKHLFKDSINKTFLTYDEFYKLNNNIKYDIVLSLDVIYHLVDDFVYEKYIHDLITYANKYIIIYSSNFDEIYNNSHVYHRKFTDYIKDNYPTLKLIYFEPNKYPTLSSANFYVYSI